MSIASLRPYINCRRLESWTLSVSTWSSAPLISRAHGHCVNDTEISGGGPQLAQIALVPSLTTRGRYTRECPSRSTVSVAQALGRLQGPGRAHRNTGTRREASEGSLERRSGAWGKGGRNGKRAILLHRFRWPWPAEKQTTHTNVTSGGRPILRPRDGIIFWTTIHLGASCDSRSGVDDVDGISEKRTRTSGAWGNPACLFRCLILASMLSTGRKGLSVLWNAVEPRCWGPFDRKHLAWTVSIAHIGEKKRERESEDSAAGH